MRTLKITDGTTSVDLLDTRNGFLLSGWTPALPDIKNNGVFADGVFTDGRYPVLTRFANIIDTFSLKLRGDDQDMAIQYLNRLLMLLEKGRQYWTTEWQNTPVYIVAQGPCETNPRYAVIVDYRIPSLSNPYTQPFFGKQALIDNIDAAIEHKIWQSTVPGTGTCVQASSVGNFFGVQDDNCSPAQSSDDGQLIAGVLTLNGSTVSLGHPSGGSSEVGIRFTGVDIPKGSTIVSAFVRFTAGANKSATTVNLEIKGELANNAATFTTAANFSGRTRTASAVNWDSIPAWTAPNMYDSPAIKTIITEITGQAGWVSGNSLVLFFKDNASTVNADRWPYAWDNGSSYPVLIVEYATTKDLGRTATCLDEVVIANKYTTQQLDHVFWYDASTGIWSRNLMDVASPYRFALLPPIPAAGDMVYFGIYGYAWMGEYLGALDNLVFDIAFAASDITTGVWEYWNGGAWAALTVKDNTALFTNLGVNTVVGLYEPVGGGVTETTVNGVVGMWVRFRVTAVGASPKPPEQGNRLIYSAVLPYVDIDSTQISGDIAAYSRVIASNQSRNAANEDGTYALIMGLRSISRGNLFNAYINLTDNLIGTGIAIIAYTTGSRYKIDNSIAAPTHRSIQNDAGLGSSANYYPAARIQFMLSRVAHYAGTYHMYVRYTQSGGADNDYMIKARLYAGTSDAVETPAVPMSDTFSPLTPRVVDLGIVTIPGPKPGYAIANYYIDLMVKFQPVGATANMQLIDVILMPADEWIGSYYDPGDSTTIDPLGVGESLDVNAVTVPKMPDIAARTSGAYETGAFKRYTSGIPILQSKVDQRLWFLALDYNIASSYDNSPRTILHSVQLYALLRYLAMRGDE